MSKVRVLIADDSPTALDIIEAILQTDPDIQVVGRATNGRETVEMAAALKPHVITIDIHMPVMNGLEAIRRIMAYHPTPILVITSSMDANIAFQSLSVGALEVLEKPELEVLSNFKRYDEFNRKIKLISKVRVVTHLAGRHVPAPADDQPPAVTQTVGIVASTGGPRALASLLSQLPKNLAASVLIVQHIAEGFVQGLVEWLDDVSPLNVHLARPDVAMESGHVYIADTGCHLEVSETFRLILSDRPADEGQRPSGNLLLESLARVSRHHTVGVVLTGMGHDGARGLKAILNAGGHTIAQDEATSLIFGMPKEAIERGAAEQVLPLDAIAPEIVRLAGTVNRLTY